MKTLLFLLMLVCTTVVFGQTFSTTLLVQGSTSTGKMDRERRLMLTANKFIYNPVDTTLTLINNDIIVKGKVNGVTTTKSEDTTSYNFDWTCITPSKKHYRWKVTFLYKPPTTQGTYYELTLIEDKTTLKYKGTFLLSR